MAKIVSIFNNKDGVEKPLLPGIWLMLLPEKGKRF